MEAGLKKEFFNN